MSDLSQHSEWLSLIEVSGPFLAEPVLKDAFPQGLEGLDGAKKKLVRQAYDEWREAIDLDDPDALKIHKAWIDLVLRQGLELDEDGAGDVLKHGGDLPELKCERPEHGVTLTPDFAVVDGQSGPPLMLVTIYEPRVVLSEALKQGTWSASPGDRMVELCRATGVRLGLVTNGEQWMFVDAPVGAVTTFASWYGRLWAQEPITLQAFVSLLGIRRFFVDRSEQLPGLLDNSLKYQDEVTDALGEQVRRAVEVLVQALDRAHVDSNRTLLEGVEPAELYEAGLTVMMRIVFLLSAEERGLLLLGDELYEANYAVSTLRLQLRAESEEILERRWDAWSRLLSLFRAVYGGIDHEALRLPALGGSLFDPDRFPFLEGRPRGSRWKVEMARPLPIDNRTVLLILEAVQLFRGRTLSYMALDVEQIGYVYEGLLERTVVRAAEVTLDLDATKSAMNPWVTLPEIEDAAAQGQDALETLLKDRTESSASRVRNDLNRLVDDDAAEKLLTACHADRDLRDRVKPYFHLLRNDPWGYPLVYPKGAFMVASGSDRRETGSHYTPKSLTEAIVIHTLEPLAYDGPSEGKPRDEWQLRPPHKLLELKICDPAMGSGAFLVQACRWLSERLVESWAEMESHGRFVTAEGEVTDEIGLNEGLCIEPNERLITARRLIAERCLYGVDLNPLAIELAKLSIWLITMAKGRPFGFLDHNLRRGDSLLGISDLDQLRYLEMDPALHRSRKLFASTIDDHIATAIELRLRIRERPIRDIRDVEVMALLDEESRQVLELADLVADAMVGETFKAGSHKADFTPLSFCVGDALTGGGSRQESLREIASSGLSLDLPKRQTVRRPLHWPLEFPEVFSGDSKGFDAIIGNPPFMGGSKITTRLGAAYLQYLLGQNEKSNGKSDLCAYFLRRSNLLIRANGCAGLILTNTSTQGATRATGLTAVIEDGAQIYYAIPSMKWPGNASVQISLLSFSKSASGFKHRYDDTLTLGLSIKADPLRLLKRVAYIGTVVIGKGFELTDEERSSILKSNPKEKRIILPYINGSELNKFPDQMPRRWIIDFGDLPLQSDPDGPSASDYPYCLAHVEREVKPQRDLMNRRAYRERWWQFAERQSALYRAISGHTRVLVVAQVGKHLAFSFLPPKVVFDQKLIVFTEESWSIFSLYQSTIHRIWARRPGSLSLRTDATYTVEYCCETFARPPFLTGSHGLNKIGEEYYLFRSDIMTRRSIGLTKLYNEFHDPENTDTDIVELRRLHMKLDEEVMSAYGWSDISLNYEHRLTTEGTLFIFSDSTCRQVLLRLSELNQKFKSDEHADAVRTAISVHG